MCYHFEVPFRLQSTVISQIIKKYVSDTLELLIFMPILFSKIKIAYVMTVQYLNSLYDSYTLDIFFRQITTFIKVCVEFVFGLQTL